MSSGFNQGTFCGNLGRDAELTTVGQGTSLLKLNVAVTTRIKKQGEWIDDTQWVSAAVFGKRAEALGRLNLTKGTKVLVTGRVSVRAYTDKGGEARASLDLMADDVVLLGGGKGGGGNGGGRSEKTYGSGAGDWQGDQGGADFGDDDVPFMPVDERLA